MRHRTLLRTAFGFVICGALTFAQQRSPASKPWPPGVQQVPPQSPALAPAEALKTFYMPPGYRLELVASEPLVQDPVAMDWDPDGRLWIVEMPGFVPNLAAPEPNLAPIGRVVVLEDRDNDGVMDKRTVFADGLALVRAVKVLDIGVLVGEPPNAWLMRDTNGDLRMDTKEVITNAYGRRDGRVEQNANGFFWAMDNRMYTANGDLMLRLKDRKFEARKTLMRGEWGATQDDAGRLYRNTNSEAIHVDLVPTDYYARNPNLLRTRGSYENLTDDATSVNAVWPVRPNPGTNRSYQFGILRPDGTLANFTSVCAPEVYRGDRLPAELYGNVFVAEPAANVVSRLLIRDDGSTLRAKKAYEHAEFLASTDERFRPVALSTAPDGTLYIADMYRGVIQQRADVTEYLRDQITSRQLEDPIGLGRIYRVMHDSTRRAQAPALSNASALQLVQALSHPNGWWRDTAQRLLVERGTKGVEAPLRQLAGEAGEARTRLHALWTLDGTDAIDAATVTRALADTSRDVRVAAVRISERWLSIAGHPMRAAVSKLADDSDWNVRQQLAASAGALPPDPRAALTSALLGRYGDQPVVADAAISGLRGMELVVLNRLLDTSAPQTAPHDAAITMLAATAVRSADENSVQQILAALADDTRPAWQRTALVRGVEIALVGGAMPGIVTRGYVPPPAAVAPPCSTCPGGRAGPGGAYAFPQVPAAARGAGPRVRLNREPTAFITLAARSGELSTRAAALLPRVEWPGKPGAAAPLTPLTPDEQRRFDAGADVYKNVCVACHQPDGRGQDKLAASLIGSTLALAAADIPARILLNGKEGSTGLMPPVGSTLTDAQIAAVLTYIRREWSQGGTPVEAATIKDVRALTAGRTRPWTNAELTALIK